jgi:dienelactone hydrolase
MWNPDDYLERLYSETKPALSFSGKPEEWAGWREALKKQFIAALGGFPERPAQLDPVLLERAEYEEYIRERVELTTYDQLRMPVYVLIPKRGEKPFPAVIACHGHGYGSKQIVGLNPDGTDQEGGPGQYKGFAVELVRRGFLVIVPEILGFGDRRLREDAGKPANENSCFRISVNLLMMGKTMAGHRVYETMRAVDYAVSRADAAKDRIGCMGISGGGLVAAFTAALDERIRATVVSCYTNTFKDSIMAMRHCVDNYIPGILDLAEMPDLIGLIAPRPLMIEAGKYDRIFPYGGVLKAFARLEQIYGAANARHRLDSDFFEGGHEIGGGKAYGWLSSMLSVP